jgi:hypothetical protein
VSDRDDDQDNAQLQPVASSTDVTVRDAAKHASVPLRRIRAGECRCEEFLYELKAGPAGGLRPPSGPHRQTGAGEPDSPSTTAPLTVERRPVENRSRPGARIPQERHYIGSSW